MFNESVFLGLIVVICAFQSITCPLDNNGKLVLPQRPAGMSDNDYEQLVTKDLANSGFSGASFNIKKKGPQVKKNGVDAHDSGKNQLPGLSSFPTTYGQQHTSGDSLKPSQPASPDDIAKLFYTAIPENGDSNKDGKGLDPHEFSFMHGTQQSPTPAKSPDSVSKLNSQDTIESQYRDTGAKTGHLIAQMMGGLGGGEQMENGRQGLLSPASVTNKYPEPNKQATVQSSEPVIRLDQLFGGNGDVREQDKSSGSQISHKVPDEYSEVGVEEAAKLAENLATHFKNNFNNNGGVLTNADYLGLCKKGVDQEKSTLKEMKKADDSLIFVISHWINKFRQSFNEINPNMYRIEPTITKAYIECVRFNLVLTRIN